MSTHTIAHEKNPLWKQAGNWITKHPGLFDLGIAGGFAGLAFLSHASPALTGMLGGLAATQIFISFVEAAEKGALAFKGFEGATRAFALTVGCGSGFQIVQSALQSPTYFDQQVTAIVRACPAIGSQKSLKLLHGESATILILSGTYHEEIDKDVSPTHAVNVRDEVNTKISAKVTGQIWTPDIWSGVPALAPYSHSYEANEAISTTCRPEQIVKVPAAAVKVVQHG